MVTLYSFLAFIIVGIMWGTSDAFMEVGSKNNESTLTSKQNKDSEKQDEEQSKGTIELGHIDK